MRDCYFAFAFRLSAQYFFIRREIAFFAAADILRPRFLAVFIEPRTARRPLDSANSGNVRSMAIISARSCFKVDAAPALASSRNLSILRPLCPLGIQTPWKNLGQTIVTINVTRTDVL